jgi:hypothetical protein
MHRKGVYFEKAYPAEHGFFLQIAVGGSRRDQRTSEDDSGRVDGEKGDRPK